MNDKIPAIPNDRYQQQETEIGKIIVDNTTGEVIATPSEDRTSLQQEIKSEKHRTYGPLDPPDKETQQRSIIVVLSFACILLLICAGILGAQTYRMSKSVSFLTAENTELNQKNENLGQVNSDLRETKVNLQKEVQDLNSEVSSLSISESSMRTKLSGIGFIVFGSPYYHRFDCEICSNANSYQAHNIEYCEFIGYEKCPLCSIGDEMPRLSAQDRIDDIMPKLETGKLQKPQLVG